MTGTISKASGLITGTIKSNNPYSQTMKSSKTLTSLNFSIKKNDTVLNSTLQVHESASLANRSENQIRTSKMADISKNDKTGDVVVKFFDVEGNKIFQEPPEQYLKIKELSNNSSGSLIDILI